MPGLEATECFRLGAVHMVGFRGVRQCDLTFGGVTILTGRNGLGKTTVFDAVDWALFGDDWRLGHEEGDVLANLWHGEEPRVVLDLEGPSKVTLVRTRGGATWNGSPFSAIDHLVTDKDIFRDVRSAPNVLRRLMYLSQEEIADTVLGTDEQREALLSAIAGVPRVELFRRNAENTFKDIESRRREQQGALEGLTQRTAELRTLLEEVRAAGEQVATTMAEAATVLGAGAGRTVPELLVALDAAHLAEAGSASAIELQGARLRRLAEAIGNALVRRTKAAEAAGQVEAQAKARRAAVAAAEAALREAQEGVEKAAAVLRVSEDHATICTGVLARLRERAERRSQWDVLCREIDECERELAVARDHVARASIEHEAAAAQVVDTRGRHGLARKRLLQLRACSALDAAERSAAEQADLLRRAEDGLRRNQGALEELRKRVVEVRQASSREGTAAQRLARVVAELHEVQPAGTDRCVLCGHEHGTSERLWKSISRSVSSLEDAAESERAILASLEEQLRKATDDAEEARLEVARVSRTREDAVAAVGQAEKAMQEVGTARRAEPVAEPELAGAEEGEARYRAQAGVFEERAIELADSLQRARSVADRVASRLGALHEQRDAAVALAEAEGKPSGDGPSGLVEAEESAAGARRALQDARDALAARQLTVRRAEEALDSVRRELTRDDGKLRRLQEEQQTADDECAVASGELAEYGVSGAVPDLACAAIERARAADAEATAARTRFATIVRLRNELRSASARDPVRLGEELRAAERSSSETRGKLMRLERATARLEEIRKAVLDRARAAGREALRGCDEEVNWILQSISRHAHLTNVAFSDDGELSLGDALLRDRRVLPRPYCSTGQVSALALAVFLGMALHHRVSKLQLIMLDEPVQHLDDVRFLNLCDLVRLIARDRQVLLSTADRNAGELWRRKLMLWNKHQGRGLRIYRFMDFDPDKGPTVEPVEPPAAQATASATG